jgi:hypothetical protein
MDSKSYEVLGSTQKQEHSEEHQESTLNGVKEINMQKEPLQQLLNHVKGKSFANPENCFWGSSLYYGGPDEDYATSQVIKANQDEIKTEVKQLEEAMDPCNLEYTVRGNWWNGSLYY